MLNPAAERLLRCDAREIVGQRIDKCLDFVDLEPCLSHGQEAIGQTVQRGKSWPSFNIAPIRVGGHSTGAIVSFQDVTRIQEIEARFRNEVLAKQFVALHTFDDIIGRSPRIDEARQIAREMVGVEATVLIGGESGTGKELFCAEHPQREPTEERAVRRAQLRRSLSRNIPSLLPFVERLVVIAGEKLATPAVLRRYSDDVDGDVNFARARAAAAVASAPTDKDAILQTLRVCNQNRMRAAQRLGIDRTTLYRKLRLHIIPTPKA